MDQVVKMQAFGVSESRIATGPVYKFYRAAQALGFSKDNLFRVTQITNINTPWGTFGDSTGANKMLFVKSGSVPARKIQTAKVNYKSFSFNVPMGASYPGSTNWALSFYSDDSYLIRNMFEYWSNQVFNEHSSSSSLTNLLGSDIALELYKPGSLGSDRIQVSEPGTASNSTKVKDIRLTQERVDIFELNLVKKYLLKGCFPVSVDEMKFNPTTAGALCSVNVNFAFQYLESSAP